MCKQFNELTESQEYDGIWACASLLHVPSQEIEDVLQRIFRVLKKDGVLYFSVKEGEFEGLREGRYFTDYTIEKIKALIKDVSDVNIVDIWKTEEVRQEYTVNWINVIIRK